MIENNPTWYLPVELQDLIIDRLDLCSVIAASRVCRLWQELGFRKLRRYCQSNVPTDVLEELKSAEIGLGWDSLYLKWKAGGLPCNVNNLYKEENVRQRSHRQPIGCMTMADNFVIVGDTKGTLSCYDLCKDDITSPSSSLDLQDEHLYQVVYMEGFRLLLAVGETSLHFITLTSKAMILMSCPDLPMLCRRVSTFGHRLVVDRRPDVLHYMEIFDIDGTAVTLKLIHKIISKEWIYTWTLFGNKISCLLNSGEVACWDTRQESWSHRTEPYSEVKYQNPCWFFRDHIFCSSQTSRSLLAYWHMDRGVSYWMVGSPGPQLEKVYLGACRDEVVTCVSMGRKLLVLGTDSGNVMVYSCLPNSGNSPSNFDYDNPSLEFNLDERPIKSIYLHFVGNKVCICVRLNKHDFKWVIMSASNM